MYEKRIGIIIFDGVEVLDFCGPFEVFSAVRRNEERRRETTSPFEVLLVAEHDHPVRATGGMRVLPDATFDECPKLDILCVPGGWGTRREVANEAMLKFLRERSKKALITSAVCTGSMLLGFAGLLGGKRATTHWKSLEWMAEALPYTDVVRDQHYVWDENTVTSAGISAGIDMALSVVERVCGREVALNTARHMEYRWPTDLARRV